MEIPKFKSRSPREGGSLEVLLGERGVCGGSGRGIKRRKVAAASQP